MHRLTARVALVALPLMACMLAPPVVEAGTVVQFDFNVQVEGTGGVLSSVLIDLFDSAAPLTVANFLQYVNNGRYDSTFIHRSVLDFVIQGGGFGFDDEGMFNVPSYGPVLNEFSPSRPNVAGTIAMAKLGGDPNSATSQWFFNISDNSANLDTQNGGFTVFGRVVGEGMALINAINGLPTGIFASPYEQTPAFGADNSLVFINQAYVVAAWCGAGPNTAWSTAANWTAAAVPAANAPIAFFGQSGLTPYNDVANREVGGLEFVAGAGEFRVTGESLLVSSPILNYAANPQTIALPLEFTEDGGVFFAAPGSKLTIEGQVTGDTGVVKDGLGVVELLDSAYTGDTAVLAGTLRVGNLIGAGSTTIASVPSPGLAVLKADVIIQNSLTIGANGIVELTPSSAGTTAAAPVPEPATAMLLLTALVGLLIARRRRI